jgi:ubiquinone/menaquinone biosynthesis C-methylase UbiE
MAQQEGTYYIPLNEEELNRQIRQDQFINERMDLIPRHMHLPSNAFVVDLACGPGGWALELAFNYHDITIVGGDVNPSILDYARARAATQEYTQRNIEFRLMDILDPLPFADDSVDFVNARFISGMMHNAGWNPLLREGLRILKPGGIIRFTEADTWSLVGCPSAHQMQRMLAKTLSLEQRGFSQDELAASAMLGAFFQQAGCQDIREYAYPLNFSHGQLLYEKVTRNFEIGMGLMKRHILKNNPEITEALYDDLLNAMVQEFRRPDFRGVWYMMSVCGEKPK